MAFTQQLSIEKLKFTRVPVVFVFVNNTSITLDHITGFNNQVVWGNKKGTKTEVTIQLPSVIAYMEETFESNKIVAELTR